MSDTAPVKKPLAAAQGYFDATKPPSMSEQEIRSAAGVLRWLAGYTGAEIVHAVDIPIHLEGERISRSLYQAGTALLGHKACGSMTWHDSPWS